jgi:hypothetical protein
MKAQRKLSQSTTLGIRVDNAKGFAPKTEVRGEGPRGHRARQGRGGFSHFVGHQRQRLQDLGDHSSDTIVIRVGGVHAGDAASLDQCLVRTGHRDHPDIDLDLTRRAQRTLMASSTLA